jgi:hypothetical protein
MTTKLIERLTERAARYDTGRTPAGSTATLLREARDRLSTLEGENERRGKALQLIAQQNPRPSNSDDPHHEHYLRTVLISLATQALSDPQS